MSKVSELSLIELEPYIKGKMFTGKAKDFVVISPDNVEDFLTKLEEFPIAKQVFDVTENASSFYSAYPDFKKYFDKEIRTEVYYAAKNGGMYRMIPSYCVYILKKAWKECNGIANLICKVIPTSCLETFLQEDYFKGGLTLYDVICNVCTSDYTPLSSSNLKVRNGDFYELYIKDTDMVAAVPDALANLLTDEALLNIEVSAKDLLVDGVPLRTLSGYVGAINSTYDLRELL